jgi:hypothetical protein
MYMYICEYIHIYIYIYKCFNIYIYVYIYVYIIRDVTSSGRRYGKEREERLNEPPTGDLPVRILHICTYIYVYIYV